MDDPDLKTMFDLFYMQDGLETGQYVGSIFQLYMEDD